jgi:hypothetical protein
VLTKADLPDAPIPTDGELRDLSHEHALGLLQRLGCDAVRVLCIDNDPDADVVLYETAKGTRATAFVSTIQLRGDDVACLLDVAPGFAAVQLRYATAARAA